MMWFYFEGKEETRRAQRIMMAGTNGFVIRKDSSRCFVNVMLTG